MYGALRRRDRRVGAGRARDGDRRRRHRRQAARPARRRADRHARRPRSRSGRRAATRSASSRPASPRPATTARTAKRAKTRSRCSSSRSSSPPRMIIFGAVDFTAALARVAKLLGFRVDRVRRPRGVRDGAAVPDGRRGRERLARPVPRQGRRRAHRRATPSACSPTTTSSTSPRSSAAVQTEGRLHRRDGLAPHQRGPRRAAPRSRA